MPKPATGYFHSLAQREPTSVRGRRRENTGSNSALKNRELNHTVFNPPSSTSAFARAVFPGQTLVVRAMLWGEAVRLYKKQSPLDPIERGTTAISVHP